MNIFDQLLGAPATSTPPPPDMLAEFEAKIRADLEKSRVMPTEAIEVVMHTLARLACRNAEERRFRAEFEHDSTATRRFDDKIKGLTLAGGVGCGKTFALRCVAKFAGGEVVNVPELSIQFAANGAAAINDFIQRNAKKMVVIDDLGAENGTAKNYGREFPVCELIFARYNSMQLHGSMTCFATNLSGAEIKTRYGERVFDRLKEMTDFFAVGGGSLRG